METVGATWGTNPNKRLPRERERVKDEERERGEERNAGKDWKRKVNVSLCINSDFCSKERKQERVLDC